MRFMSIGRASLFSFFFLFLLFFLVSFVSLVRRSPSFAQARPSVRARDAHERSPIMATEQQQQRKLADYLESFGAARLRNARVARR